MDEPVVGSIIIVTYNSSGTIRECLRAIQAYTHTPHEVIVCDNASTDDTINIISREFPSVKINRNLDNLGFAAANNLGANLASGLILAFINPDLYVCEGWFESLMGCLESDSNTATASPVIRHLAQPEVIEAIGNKLYLSGLTYLQKFRKASRGGIAVPITAVSGACFVIRRDLFERVGGFCENYFLYYEDTDLSIRLRMLGLRHLAVPDIKVTHDYRPSFSESKIFYLERNRYLTQMSLYPLWSLLISLPAAIFSEFLIWAFCILKGKTYFDAKARAWADILHKKAWVQERRRYERGSQTVSDIWLAELSPFINLQYLQRGLISQIAEVILFIVALPGIVIFRLAILISGKKKL